MEGIHNRSIKPEQCESYTIQTVPKIEENKIR